MSVKHGAWVSGLVVALMVHGAVGATYYWGGGATDLSGPIPTGSTAPYGVWNTTIKNWATDASGTSYAAWSGSGSDTAVFQNIALNNQSIMAPITQTVDLAVGRITAVITNASGSCYNSGYLITATNSRTITLSGDSPEISVVAAGTWNSADNTRGIEFASNVKLVGDKGFTKTGYYGGKMVIRGDCSGVLGTVRSLDGGSVGSYYSIQVDGSSANLRGVSLFDLKSGSLGVLNPASGVNNQIGDAAVIRLSSRASYKGNRLSSSGFEYASTVNSIEEFSQVRLDPFGTLVFQSGGATPGQLILNHPLAGIDRGRDGHGTALVQLAAGRSFKTTVIISNGVPTGVTLPWMVQDTGEPLRLSPSNTLEIVPVTGAPLDLATWGGNANYSITNSTFTPSNYVTNGCRIDTLSINGPSSGSAVVTVGTGVSDLLTIGSGVIGFYARGGNGLVLTNGSITSGTNELNVFSGSGSANGGVAIYSRVVGDLALTLAGSKEIILYNANTHGSGTYVKNVVTLQQASCLPGPVIVEAGGLCKTPLANAISTNANVTIRQGGEISIPDGSGDSQTYSGLLFIDGGWLSCGNGYGGGGCTFNSPSGILFGDGGSITQVSLNGSCNMRLYTDVACSADSSNQATIATCNTTNLVQFLDLTTGASATRTFTVSNAVGLAATTAELLIDIPLRTASSYPATLVKAGAGMLELNRVSGAFSGSAVISNGTLRLSAFAPATNLACTITSGSATITGLSSTNGLLIGQLLATNSAVGSGRYIQKIDSSSQVTLTGTASGSTNVLSLLASGPLGTSSVTVVSGILDGVGGVGGNVTVKSGGTLAPGVTTNTTATFSVGGNLTVESGGTLSVDLANGTNDMVTVSGSVNITGGTLLVNGPKPVAGTVLPILTSTNITASFTTVTDGYAMRVVGNQLQLVRKSPGFVFSAQ